MLVVIVGELPEAHRGFVAELADTVPDLSDANRREFFADRRRPDAGAAIRRQAQGNAALLREGRARRNAGGASGAVRRAPGRGAGVEFRSLRKRACGGALSGLPVFGPGARWACAGDAAGPGRRSQPQIACVDPASAGQRKRLGQRRRLRPG